MESEVKLFFVIGCVFLCVGYDLMKLFYGVESNDLLYCFVAVGIGAGDRCDWTETVRS